MGKQMLRIIKVFLKEGISEEEKELLITMLEGAKVNPADYYQWLRR